MKKSTLLVLFAAATAMQGCRVYQPGSASRRAYVDRQQQTSDTAAPRKNAVRTSDTVTPVSVKPVASSSVKPVSASPVKPVAAAPVKPVQASSAPVASINAVSDYKGSSVTSAPRRTVAAAPAQPAPAPVYRPAPAAADTVNARPEYAGTNSGLTSSHTPGASIAAPAPRAAVAAADNYKIYTVQPGDSAGRIANANGMTLSEFTALNNISDANLIRVGQTVKVAVGRTPIAAPAPSRVDPVQPRSVATPSAVGEFHVVQEGECLSRIASQHGLTSAQLMEYNSLKDANHITVGQKLRLSPANGAAAPAPASAVSVPAPAQPAVPAVPAFPEHTEYSKVVTGEAAVPGTSSTIDDIMANGLIDAAPEPVAVPAPAPAPAPVPAVEPAAPAPAPAAPASADAPANTYTIGLNEDTYKVAEKFKCTPMDLRRLNPNCEFKPGDVIKIPGND